MNRKGERMAKELAFLHTAPTNVATFARLLAEIDPSIPARHVVDESLLNEARAVGMTPALVERVHGTLTDMLAGSDGADAPAVVLCTCSTIGGCAEEVVAPDGRAVLRVDRAMAERAVTLGQRIVVAAALQSTLEPTNALLLAVAAQRGRTITLVPLLCEGAWSRFEAGDQAGYWAMIAEKLAGAEALGDVIVLAQASMAGAVALCDQVRVPILSSPRLGMEAAVAAYRARVAPL